MSLIVLFVLTLIKYKSSLHKLLVAAFIFGLGVDLVNANTLGFSSLMFLIFSGLLETVSTKNKINYLILVMLLLGFNIIYGKLLGYL